MWTHALAAEPVPTVYGTLTQMPTDRTTPRLIGTQAPSSIRSSMVIRPLTPDDAPAYVALRREMLADAPWAFFSSPEDDRGVQLDTMRQSLATPGFVVIGAWTEHGSLVSVAGVLRESKAKRAHVATIWGVYVTPAARRHGLARAVVAAAIATVRSWPDMSAVLLSVSERSPAARRVYESLGFVAWGTEPDALRINGAPHAETHMRLALATP